MGSDARIEQAVVNMPEVSVYLDGINKDALHAAEAYLGTEHLKPVSEAKVFGETGDGIDYYVLIDISGSIPDGSFRTMKDAILALQGNVNAADRICLYTFGNEVTVHTEGEQSYEEMEAVLKELRNKDKETALFDAIHKAAGQAAKADDGQRRVMIVMTDGEDFAVGKTQSAEALKILNDSGIPMYAYGIRNTRKEYLNALGEFARNTGGDLTVFSEADGNGLLLELQSALEDDVVLQYAAESNQVSYKQEPFSIKLKDGSLLKLSHDVMVDRWIRDEENPVLQGYEPVNDVQIRLRFSEALSGLNSSANYELSRDGVVLPVDSVAYDADDHSIIVLTLKERIENGNYSLSLPGVTDTSMESNPVLSEDNESGIIRMSVTDIPEMTTAAAEQIPEQKPIDYRGAFFLIFAAIIALIIVLIALGRKKKKTSAGRAGTPAAAAAPESVVMGDAFRNQQHIHVASQDMKVLEVTIMKNGKQPIRTNWKIGSSLIVGRAATSDISLDDPKMSKQHFCLERVGQDIYISDLNSTNGTMVNGIRMKMKRKLSSGDEIQAGTMKLMIRW